MVPTTTQQPVAGKVSPVAAKTSQVAAQPGTVAPGMEPPKKSIFKKWWFWLIVVLVLVGLGVGGWSLFK